MSWTPPAGPHSAYACMAPCGLGLRKTQPSTSKHIALTNSIAEQNTDKHHGRYPETPTLLLPCDREPCHENSIRSGHQHKENESQQTANLQGVQLKYLPQSTCDPSHILYSAIFCYCASCIETPVCCWIFFHCCVSHASPCCIAALPADVEALPAKADACAVSACSAA